jgi:hypothetical protein
VLKVNQYSSDSDHDKLNARSSILIDLKQIFSSQLDNFSNAQIPQKAKEIFNALGSNNLKKLVDHNRLEVGKKFMFSEDCEDEVEFLLVKNLDPIRENEKIEFYSG